VRAVPSPRPVPSKGLSPVVSLNIEGGERMDRDREKLDDLTESSLNTSSLLYNINNDANTNNMMVEIKIAPNNDVSSIGTVGIRNGEEGKEGSPRGGGGRVRERGGCR